jgi:peptide/nickel transport system substrate-binding protein
MNSDSDLERLLSALSPKTRRQFLKQAALMGLSTSAAQALLIKNPILVTAGPSPKRGGTVRVTGHHEISTLSPDDAGPTVHWTIVTQIHNALLEINENYVIDKVLAENYQAAPDGSVYRFKLRRGVKFHDGKEFTADDVKYTYEWYLNPANAAINALAFQGVDKVETPDKYTVVVKMKQANAAFLRRGATTFIVPAHYHSRIGEKAYKSAPMGTGAFRLKEWRPAEFTTVEAFDQHFRGRPHIDIFREDIVPDASVRAVAMRTGTADAPVWPLLAEDSLALESDTRFSAYRMVSVAVNHFPINNEHPLFSDKRVRQAMMHAIDRQRLIDDIFKGTAILATTNLAPSLQQWYYGNVKQYAYSPDRARTLLTEAGWVPGPGGVRVKGAQRASFTCTVITGDRARRPEAEVVQQDLAAVGVEMRIQERPVATILEQLPKGQLDASLFNWTYGGNGGEPDALDLQSGQPRNHSRFKNARMDELFVAGLKEVNVGRRRRIYNEVQTLFAEEVPFLYIMYWQWFNIFSKRVKGLPTSMQYGNQIFRDAYKWWVE